MGPQREVAGVGCRCPNVNREGLGNIRHEEIGTCVCSNSLEHLLCRTAACGRTHGGACSRSTVGDIQTATSGDILKDEIATLSGGRHGPHLISVAARPRICLNILVGARDPGVDALPVATAICMLGALVEVEELLSWFLLKAILAKSSICIGRARPVLLMFQM